MLKAMVGIADVILRGGFICGVVMPTERPPAAQENARLFQSDPA
jgi:hypothetical protein